MTKMQPQDTPQMDAASVAPPHEEPRSSERRMLPHDLGVALKYLSDDELSVLFRAVSAELDRRSPPVAKSREDSAQSRPKQAAKVEGLTPSQISLIQASVKAGVKPTVLSRQFGISQAQIRAALKAGT